MLILAFKPGHDGGVAVLRDGALLHSLESEKDSHRRYTSLTPDTILAISQSLGDLPDVVALGGWQELGRVRPRATGAGYDGTDPGTLTEIDFFGRRVTYYTSSHERSHIMMALGMAPSEPADGQGLQTVLVWEGDTGAFYQVDAEYRVTRRIPVMTEPGARYAFLFALADPTFTGGGLLPRLGDAGKLMALAAYASPDQAEKKTVRTVEQILALDTVHPAPKDRFADSPLFNAGVTADQVTAAAALLSERIFTRFADAAQRHLPAGTPLRISGGCGLNCEWNSRWAELGHFSSVSVPPCTNDSGSAIGTAIDAQLALTGRPHIHWDVYSGLDFVHDATPDPTTWRHRTLRHDHLAEALGQGRIVAWVQGRWEIGPRALGNRSLLAEPFRAATRERLNTIKQRESYRPIAPVCRREDTGRAFHETFADPYMLYFRRVRDQRLRAVTHVDGSARAQTVTAQANPPLHALLTAFADRHDLGVLCNTSLNFNGLGFINRMTDLIHYCDSRGINDMVVGEVWYERTPGHRG